MAANFANIERIFACTGAPIYITCRKYLDILCVRHNNELFKESMFRRGSA